MMKLPQLKEKIEELRSAMNDDVEKIRKEQHNDPRIVDSLLDDVQSKYINAVNELMGYVGLHDNICYNCKMLKEGKCKLSGLYTSGYAYCDHFRKRKIK